MNDGIGQDIPIEQAMIVILDKDGQAHGWNITNGHAAWRFVDIGETGRSKVDIEISGQMHRKIKPAEMLGKMKGPSATMFILDDPPKGPGAGYPDYPPMKELE